MSYKKKYTYSKQSVSWGDIWNVVKALRSDWLTQGPQVAAFEQALCHYTGAKYAVAVSNATAGLHLACLAAEVKQGDEGITSPITFVASANCIALAGGTVKFSDIQPETANIDPDELEKHITEKTKVLIPVHFAGQSCDMKKIWDIAKKHNLIVIEDAAHALGSEYLGKKVGSCQFSDMAIFSFHPVKNITTGEGGAITTNSKELYEKLLQLRTIGITKDPNLLTKNDGPWYYEMHDLSLNCRLSDIHAALGVSQLKKLDSFTEKKRALVDQYKQAFSNNPRFSLLKEMSYSKASFHLCPLLINFDVIKKSKQQIFENLKKEGLFLQIHYIPVHTQPYYKKLGFKEGDFPQAEHYYKQTISLPLHQGLKISDIQAIVKIIKKIIL